MPGGLFIKWIMEILTLAPEGDNSAAVLTGAKAGSAEPELKQAVAFWAAAPMDQSVETTHFIEVQLGRYWHSRELAVLTS